MITNKEIEAKDVKRLLLRVYRRYQSGTITEAQAYKETYLLNSVLKAIEATNVEAVSYTHLTLPTKRIV